MNEAARSMLEVKVVEVLLLLTREIMLYVVGAEGGVEELLVSCLVW